MKNIYVVIILLMTLNVIGQNKMFIGPSFQYGLSTIWGEEKDSVETGLTLPTFSALPSLGAGLELEYSLTKRVGLSSFFLWQQRGANFDKDSCDCVQHYRINYFDLTIGIKYKLIAKESYSLYFNGGINNTFLLSANRVNSYESADISDDTEGYTPGAYFMLGYERKIQERNLLQFSIYSTGSYGDIFSGILEMNSVFGRNFFVGIQLNYLFGLFNRTTNK